MDSPYTIRYKKELKEIAPSNSKVRTGWFKYILAAFDETNIKWEEIITSQPKWAQEQ